MTWRMVANRLPPYTGIAIAPPPTTPQPEDQDQTPQPGSLPFWGCLTGGAWLASHSSVSPKNKNGDEKRFASVSALAIRFIVPASWSAKEGEMKKAHQPCLRSPMSELLLQPPKHLELSHGRKLKCFFPRHDRLGPPQAVGPACLPLASFIFVHSPSWSFVNYWWCSEWNVRGLCRAESGCEGWGRGRWHCCGPSLSSGRRPLLSTRSSTAPAQRSVRERSLW